MAPPTPPAHPAAGAHPNPGVVMALDEAKLNAFIERAVVEMSASFSAPLLLLGDRLGLYKAMAGAGPMSPGGLAAAPRTPEGDGRGGPCKQAASGGVTV